jgi:hypothetical protein
MIGILAVQGTFVVIWLHLNWWSRHRVAIFSVPAVPSCATKGRRKVFDAPPATATAAKTDPSASTREGQGHGHWLVWHTLACMPVRACWSAVQSARPRLSVRLPPPVLGRFLSSQPGQQERAGVADAFVGHACVLNVCTAAICLLASVLTAACFVPAPPAAAAAHCCCCCFLLARAPHRRANTDCLSLCSFSTPACLSACAPVSDPCSPLRRRLSGSVCVACPCCPSD